MQKSRVCKLIKGNANTMSIYRSTLLHYGGNRISHLMTSQWDWVIDDSIILNMLLSHFQDHWLAQQNLDEGYFPIPNPVMSPE